MKLLLCWILLSVLIGCFYGSRKRLGYMITFFFLCLLFGPLGGFICAALVERNNNNNNPPSSPSDRKRFDIEQYRAN